MSIEFNFLLPCKLITFDRIGRGLYYSPEGLEVRTGQPYGYIDQSIWRDSVRSKCGQRKGSL